MVLRPGLFMRKGIFMLLKRGFTLIEMSLAVVLAAIMASALVPNFVRSLHIEAARKSAVEMAQIAEAGRMFYIQQNAWPDDLQALKTAGFIDHDWNGKNPFGDLYSLALSDANLDVLTTVPQDMAPVVAGFLPMAVAQGALVRMSVTPPGAAIASVPTGAVMPWTSDVIPDGWLMCDGQAVSRSENSKLFAVIGTTYGAGNGSSTFNLPDLRGRTVVGLDNMGGVSANVLTGAWAKNTGGMFGEEKHVLTTGEMPAHVHDTKGTYVHYSNVGPNGSMETTGAFSMSTQSAGSGAAHNIVQPSMALVWIIRT